MLRLASRSFICVCLGLLAIPMTGRTCAAQSYSRLPGELTWTIAYDPKTFDPAKVDDEASEAVRYLTAGVLLRFNRLNQQLEPRLAETWSLSPDGKTITFRLRPGLRFSDGSSLTANDVSWSLRRVLAPATAAPAAEEFLTPSTVTVEAPDNKTVVVHLSKRVIAIGKVFDEIAIEPADRPSEGRVTAGPFVVAEYGRSQYVRLRRNPYFLSAAAGTAPLPRATGIRLAILKNPELEIRRFERGEYDMIENLPPDYFELLRKTDAGAVRDLGPSLNTEQLWFNQAPESPLPAWEKAWFQSRVFRVAISQAIDRADLARIAYLGHATPAYTFISPANTAWYYSKIAAPHTDVAAARAALAAAGFRLSGAVLKDASGHDVKFSILTNAGNAGRFRMATLIQQDLAALGIQVNVVTLDFPALVERLMHTQDYEACMLGLENVDPEPNAMMNVWLSSSPNHQWNPSEKLPATPWEAEIDGLMNQQASSSRDGERKQVMDRVQQIVADQQPFIYLVYPNGLVAVSPKLQGVRPAVLEPALAWNVEELQLQGGAR